MCDRICQERWKECMVRGPQSLECLGGNALIDNDDGPELLLVCCRAEEMTVFPTR